MSDFRKSRWRYESGANLEVGIGHLLLGGGSVELKAPDEGRHHYRYSAVGVGLSVIKLMPRHLWLPEIPLPKALFGSARLSSSAAGSEFDGVGTVYMNASVSEPELKPAHFEGGVFGYQVGGGVLVAENLTVMHVGIPRALLHAAIFGPKVLFGLLGRTAPALIVSYGVSAGLVESVGGGMFFGEMQA